MNSTTHSTTIVVQALSAMLAAITTVMPAMAAGPECGSRIDDITEATSVAVEATLPVYTSNPAAMSGFLPFSLSDFGVRGIFAESDEAETTECGKGELTGNVEARSYMRLTPSTTVWGEARFTTGKKRDIKWNNSADYLLLAPYVVGDSVGGDLTTRQYSFTGGYAGSLNRWGWGAQGSYTAVIDYRARDPRDKIIVSDLEIKAGATFRINRRHTLGAAGSFRVYNQESDVEFYNPNNDIHLYPITGLGNYYPRFSSISDINTAYKGIGAGASVELIPFDRKGAFASVTFNYLDMRQVLRDFNNLELTRAGTYAITARAGWFGHAGKAMAGAVADVDISRRLGFENIFGSAVGNNYIMIGSRRNYLHDKLSGNISMPLEVTCSRKVNLDIMPACAAYYSRESYRKPRRVLSALLTAPSLSIRARWRCDRRWLLEASAMGSRGFGHELERNPGTLDQHSALGSAVIHNFDMTAADRTAIGVSAGAYVETGKGMALGISARWGHTRFDGHGNANRGEMSLALKF